MKINNRLLNADPAQGGGGTSTPSAVAPTPSASPTPSSAPQPSEQSIKARELFGDTTETKPVETVTTTPATTTTPTPEVKPQGATLTVDEVAKLLPMLQQQQQPQNGQAAPKEMTQDEIDEYLGVVKVSEDVCAQLGLPKEAAPVLHKLFQGAVTQAIRMQNVITEQRLNAIMQQINPHLQYSQEVQARAAEAEFDQAYPHLANQKTLLMAVSEKVLKGFKGSKKDAMKLIADETEKVLKTAGLDPKAVSTTANGATSAATTTSKESPKPGMSAVSGGGQGGAGGSPAGSQDEQVAKRKALFG